MDKNFDNFGIMANTGVSPNAFLMNEVANQNTQTAINSIMSNLFDRNRKIKSLWRNDFC